MEYTINNTTFPSTTMVATTSMENIQCKNDSSYIVKTNEKVIVSEQDEKLIAWLKKLSFLCGYAMALEENEVDSAVNPHMYMHGRRMIMYGVYLHVVNKTTYSDTWQVSTNGGWETLCNAFIRNRSACLSTEEDMLSMLEDTVEDYPPTTMTVHEAKNAVHEKVKELMKEFRMGSTKSKCV